MSLQVLLIGNICTLLYNNSMKIQRYYKNENSKQSTGCPIRNEVILATIEKKFTNITSFFGDTLWILTWKGYLI